MTKLAAAAAALLLAAVAVVGPGAAPAAACSCVAPDPAAPVVVFDGTASDVVLADFGFRWTIAVEEVHEGEVPGDEVAVNIDHDQVVNPDGQVAVSSCSIGAGPEVGGQYRFEVEPVAEGPFFVNLCTGSFTELAAPAEGTDAQVTAGDEDGDPPWAMIVVGGLAAVTVVGLVTLKLMSRVALRSRP